MSRKLIIFAVVFGIVILIGYYLYTNYYLPSTVTLPPPLENVDFPLEPVPYPTDWLDELKFPSEFTLVDTSSGTLPEGSTQGWAAKFRYQGETSDAITTTSSFLAERGWTIVKNDKLDSGGFSLLIQREQGSGVVIVDIDPNDPSQSLIIFTIFP